MRSTLTSLADNPAAAASVAGGIVERVDELASFPELGQRLAHRSMRGVRLLLYGHYRIVYRVAGSELVEILGVYHGALDLERRLRKPAGSDETR